MKNNLRNKALSYFINEMGFHEYTRGWLKGDCPHCGKELKYGIHLGSNTTNCFVCGYDIKPLELIMQEESLSTFNDLRLFLDGFTEIEYDYQIKERKPTSKLTLPDGFNLLMLDESLMGLKARKIMEDRGFDVEELSYKGVGFTNIGEFAYRIIIPYYKDGELVYYNARKILNDSSPKFKNPPEDQVGIGKSRLIYNHDALKLYSKIYLVESATNALTLGDEAIAIGGKSISSYQLKEVIKSIAEEIVIILDPDAWKEAVQLAMSLVHYKKVKLIKLEGDQDVNDLGNAVIRKKEASSNYIKYNQLLLLKSEL